MSEFCVSVRGVLPRKGAHVLKTIRSTLGMGGRCIIEDFCNSEHPLEMRHVGVTNEDLKV